jgi:hypothetical protein
MTIKDNDYNRARGIERSKAYLASEAIAALDDLESLRSYIAQFNPEAARWLCYRILAQECWPTLAHPPSLNLRSP